MREMKYIRRRLDKLYVELGEPKRYAIIHSPVETTRNQRAWRDLLDASEEISARWTGPGAVEEIRGQREK